MTKQSPLIDSHCHIDMVLEKGLSQGEVDENLRENGVRGVVQIGSDPQAMEFSREFCSQDSPYLRFYTVGAHPGEAHETDPEFGLQFARKHREDERFIAIGEIGLDYFYGSETKERQREVFDLYLQAALELKKPVAVHTREAHRDTVEALKQLRGEVEVLIHCFTGTLDEMYELVELGAYISYSGIVTFKNAVSLQEAARLTPKGRLLVETDAPFLAPVPVRGKLNRPGWVRHTLNFLEELRDEELGEALFQNTLNVFHLHRFFE